MAQSISLDRIHSRFEDLVHVAPLVVIDAYNLYYPEIYRYIHYRLGSEVLAEDFASDVFVRLLEAVKRGRGPHTNTRAWLVGTANHIVIDHIRQSYRTPLKETLDFLDESVSAFENVEQEVEEHERNLAFRRSLAQLTEEQQHVLALRFGQGYSLQETAFLLKKNVGSVKALQFRALTALQQKMGDQNE